MSDEIRTEVTIKGRLSFDPRLRLYNLDIETDDEGEYNCLSWSFDMDEPEDAESIADLAELLDPPALES